MDGRGRSIPQQGNKKRLAMLAFFLDQLGNRHLLAHLFSSLRHFMPAKDLAASEAVSERDAPFYQINSGRFITSGQRQIDEIRCHANLRETSVAQKLP